LQNAVKRNGYAKNIPLFYNHNGTTIIMFHRYVWQIIVVFVYIMFHRYVWQIIVVFVYIAFLPHYANTKFSPKQIEFSLYIHVTNDPRNRLYVTGLANTFQTLYFVFVFVLHNRPIDHSVDYGRTRFSLQTIQYDITWFGAVMRYNQRSRL
jgi:hypothetical protein